jgi:hypothetical protein
VDDSDLPCPDLSSNLGKFELATFYLMLYGVCTALVCWTVVLVVHVAGVERLEVRGTAGSGWWRVARCGKMCVWEGGGGWAATPKHHHY